MNRIYILVDPRTASGRYVGITCQTLANRLLGHICDAKGKCRTYCSRWIRQLQQAGWEPVMILIEETEDRSRECFWIAHYRQAGLPLTNLTDGGEGTPGSVRTPEMRLQMSLARRGRKRPPASEARKAKAAQGNRIAWARPEMAAVRARVAEAAAAPRRGKPLSEAHRKAIGDAQRGKLGHPCSEATKQILSEKAKHRPFPSEETRIKLSEASKRKVVTAEMREKCRAAALRSWQTRDRPRHRPDGSFAPKEKAPPGGFILEPFK